MVTGTTLLKSLVRKNPGRWRETPKKGEIFSELNRLLWAAGQAGQVGFILSFDVSGKQIILYRAPGQQGLLRDEAIFKALNLSIGQRGTRVNGRIRHHRGGPGVFTKGFFVPSLEFGLNLPNVWVALKNIKVEPTDAAIPFPRTPLVGHFR